MIITDIAGNTEYLTGLKTIKRFRSVTGVKSLAFLVLPTEQNKHSFPMVQEESIIEFQGNKYRIKQLNEKPKGSVVFKEVVAIHTFFDLIDDHNYSLHNGSLTFANALNFVFAGTPYTWDIVDSFYALDWENFGDDNRLALFQEVLKKYGSEFYLDGTHLTFVKKIGSSTDFQFRYKYNIKTINRSVKTNNLSTYIKGYGKDVESEYTSPNALIFGIRHAKPVRDERYTTKAGLDERLRKEIKDEPELSITIDFVDLRRVGFPFDVPNEGDDVFLIYEPMNLDVETRIMDIEEEFIEGCEIPIKTIVTLSNFRSNLVDQFVGFKQTQKTVNNILEGSQKIPFNALDDAVKRATEALQSAQTELEFENGIIARDKNNPNFIVLLNSNGIGISRDGGQTFREAITSEGFVLSAGAIGQLSANNIQIGESTYYESGYDPSTKETPDGALQKANSAGQAVRNDLRQTAPLPTSLSMNQDGITASTSDPSRYARLDYRGLFVKKGAIEIERPDGALFIQDGLAKMDFAVQPSFPADLINTSQGTRHYVSSRSVSQNDGYIGLYTFRKVARYLEFEVALSSSTVSYAAIFKVIESGSTNHLGSILSTEVLGNETVKKLRIDMGVPNFSEYAVRALLLHNYEGATAYCRIIRIRQTDF